VVTFKNAADVREAAVLCPLDRLLVETDSPFLTPVPHRGTLNEPSRVPLVGAAIAQLKQVETSVLAEHATRNTRAAFAL
jgi:TatD DNase family protein